MRFLFAGCLAAILFAGAAAFAGPDSDAPEAGVFVPGKRSLSIEPLIPAQSSWLHFGQPGEPPENWRKDPAAAAKWKHIKAPLALELPQGAGAAGGQLPALPLLKTFKIGRTVEDYHSFDLKLSCDQPCILWLNGRELLRHRIAPDGKRRSKKTPGGGGNLYRLPASALKPGENTLAVEVFADPDSRKARFELEFGAEVLAPGSSQNIRDAYLQQLTSHSVIICWRSDRAYAGSVEVDGRTFKEASPQRDHFIKVEGLKPETEYRYSTVDEAGRRVEGGEEYRFRTAPPPGASRPTRIWAIGDSGTANAHAEAVYQAYRKEAGKSRTDVWLMLGDNAYMTGTDPEHSRSIFHMYPELLRQACVWPCIGNHEGYVGGFDARQQKGPYFRAFELPRKGEAGGLASGTEAYYSFDHGDIHFVCLDSAALKVTADSPQLAWLKQDLQASRGKWLVAYFHHPPYTKGSHDSDNPLDSDRRHFDAREFFLPVLEEHGVDLVLSGHSHAYERSFLIDGHYGLSSSFDPKIHAKNAGDGRPDGKGAYEKKAGGRQGAVYIVGGSSGKISGGRLNHPAMFTSQNKLGSVVVDVEAGEMKIRFIDDKGAVQDWFSIRKP
ncbi:MAG: hypothetical protein RL095_4063 [Verrucomicrobiota bacterium]|jgi:hypothetical protein